MATAKRVDFHGWDAVQLSNDFIDATAVPEVGGRLMQFKLGAHEFLFRNRELLGKRFTFEEHVGDGTILNWKNYGGEKTWPAPQGWDNNAQWHGPPDPVLDGGRYSSEINETDAQVTMISPPDTERTGLRITRRLKLHGQATRLRFDMILENVVQCPISWSSWQNAQMDCSILKRGMIRPNTDCWLYIPGNEQGAYSVMLGDDNPQIHPAIVPGLLGVRYLGIVSKIGVASPAGWIAFADQANGYTLCMRFAYESDAEYPDGGASVECWTESPGAPSPIPIRSPGYLMEAEVLSPLRILQPGECSTYTVEWCATCCPGPITDVTDVGCVHVPLKATCDGDQAVIEGLFGCFEAGRSELVWLGDNAAVLGTIDLGDVSPMNALRVNRVEIRPPNTTSVRLDVVRDNTRTSTIAETCLH